MRIGLDTTLTQDQVLTPQLILMMKVLQASALDLDRLVTEELEKNPALEPDDGSTASSADESEPVADRGAEPEPAQPAGSETADEPTGDPIVATKPGEEFTAVDLLPDDGYIPLPVRGTGRDDDEPSGVELAAGPDQSLVETMMPHLRATLSEADAATAEFIIESLDDDGFLTIPPAEIAELRGVPLERVQGILHVIQRMDPGGVACGDRRESFLVQLELAGYAPTSLERRLLADFWELLMKKQTARVAKLCGVTEDDIRSAIQRIVGLEPRPARRYSGGVPDYVAPDFSVEWQGQELVAVPNDDRFPRLRLSRRYREILTDPKSFSKEQVAFARERLAKAQLFLKAIESRRRTLKRLVELIVEEQSSFFRQGPEHLRPATLRQAASVMGVHASTASRTIAGKYVETTFGIFPLSYFFKAGTGGKSRTSIKERIQAIVEAEDKAHPFSDDEICAKLKEEGTTISRRTVAKYRAELGVAGCNDRRGF